MGFQKLINHIEEKISLTEEERKLLEGKISIKKLRRRQFILQEGDHCSHYNFVTAGCLRMYLVDQKGTEHILQFATENWWISDIGSFHSGKTSQLYIDALEPSEVIRIKKEDLLYLYQNHLKFDRYFRVLTENAFIKMQERVLQNISSTAEDRYKSFLNNYPHLSNKISQVQIASFIGVTPEFLSKLRRNMMKK